MLEEPNKRELAFLIIKCFYPP